MPIAVVANTGKQGTPNSTTTDAIDTTGTNLIVVGLAYYTVSADPVLTDSKSNVWTPLTAYLNSPLAEVKLFYCYSPVVGSGHTFTSTGTASFAAINVIAASGVSTSPFDVQNGSNASSTTLATGSVTPSQDNEILVAFLGYDGAGTPTSIDLGFTAIDPIAYSGGNSFGSHMAYLIQTAATAKNPTWTRTNSNSMAATIAAFKAVAVAPAIPVVMNQYRQRRA